MNFMQLLILSEGRLRRAARGIRQVLSFAAMLGLLAATDNMAIAPNNTPPTITTIPDQLIDEDAVAGPIGFSIRDAETPADKLILQAGSSDEKLLPLGNITFGGTGTQRTITLKPSPNANGRVTVSVTVIDANQAAAQTKFLLSVNPINDPPTISAIPDQSAFSGQATAPISFVIGDIETSADLLLLRAASSDEKLAPVSNIKFGGAGSQRTVTITPNANVTGQAAISIIVSDPNQASAESKFVLTVNAPLQPPVIIQPPQNLVVNAGETATFSVRASGSPPLQYQWQFNKIDLTGANGPSLILENVNPRQAGDYAVIVKNEVGTVVSQPASLIVRTFDFGDAPDTYRTTRAVDGARHIFSPDFPHLGARIDAEPDGQPSADARGDDNNAAGAPSDEDGVTFSTVIVPGSTAIINVVASGVGRLDAWVDWNLNGTFADAGERIFTATPLSVGNNTLTISVPSTAKPGASFARFRLSRDGVKDFFGPAPDGEVEDYQIKISEPPVQTFDFGDAPDTYRTTLAVDGARHNFSSDLPHLGLRIDSEPDGQPSADARGDDNNPAGAPSDEDGVFFDTPLTAGSTAQIRVVVTGQGLLDAWIDWNLNGTFADAGERIFTAKPLNFGTNTLAVAVPSTAQGGASYARFRFSRGGVKDFFGPAPDGEVEDYQVKISADVLDFGDAPQLEQGGYPTTLSRNGARHTVVRGFSLGKLIDPESDGQPNLSATGDDLSSTDDEDGVLVTSPLVPGQIATVDVIAPAGGRLDAWIDFNANFSWADAGDRIFTSVPLTPGVNSLSFTVPASATPGQTYARFRLSKEGRLNFDGFGGDGEVEDYLVRIERPTPCDLSCSGTDFWVAFPGNYAPDPSNPVKPQLCIVGAPGTSVTTVIPSLSFNKVLPIPAGGSLTIPLPKETDLGDSNDELSKKGVHVTATAPVSLYGISQVQFTSDGFLGIPTEALGTEYVVAAFGNVHPAVPELNGTQFAIVATENSTTVTIIPSSVIGSHDAGFPYTITLDQGQTYQLRNTNGPPSDLTGTIVTADKPVAVFGSHQCANVRSEDVFYCDYLVEELPPVNRWAQQFFTRPLATRLGGDTFRVVAAFNNTAVRVNGATVAHLDRGEFFGTNLTAAVEISADHPILVLQYANSSDFDGVVNSDPFMMIVPGRPLYNTRQTFCSPSGFLTHHINVIAPVTATGSIQLDGAPFAAAFSPIGLSGFAHATTPVGAGVHTVTAAQPIGVTVYGWNQYESYGWPACLFFGDTTPPTIECPTNQITVTAGAAGIAANIPCQAMIPDLRNGVKFSDNCRMSDNTIVQQTPRPGTFVRVGTHDIVLSVTDAQGNIGRCTVKFTVLDPNPDGPLSIECPPDMVVGCTQSDGAIVNYEAVALKGCTPIPLECTPPSGSFFPLGTTVVTCRLNQPGFPAMECSFKVTVQCRRLGISVIGRRAVLDWSAGAVLESAAAIEGPWAVVEGAVPPFEIQFVERSRFYRIRE